MRVRDQAYFEREGCIASGTEGSILKVMVTTSSGPSGQASSGPNPVCEVGMRHPRDRHRMRPVEGYPHVWVCQRHSIFAQLVEKDIADTLERGDEYAMHDGGAGLVVRHGDERQGGVIVYYRAK